MTTLHDRLADLADLADTAPGALPDPDLWGRGRRYGRRRRMGTAVVVVATLALLGVVVGASELRSRSTVQPASPTSTPALPTRLVHPSVWLEGTDDAGPLGPLAFAMRAGRGGWTGTSDGVVGVSATTGEYRFLDLPDLVPDDEIALAPDGRHLAYWYTGETRRSPNSDSGPVIGLAVYDTTTGEVVRQHVPSDHGLMVNDRPVWVDRDRLVFSYAVYRGGDGDDEMDQSSGAHGPGLLLWEPASGETVLLPARWGTSVRATDRAGHLLMATGRRGRFVSVDDPEGAVRGAVSGSYMVGDLAVSSAGAVAWPKGGRHPNRLTVVAPGGEPRVVPRSARTFAGVAWLDDQHVVVSRRLGAGYRRVGLFRVDVSSGESTLLLELPQKRWGPDVGLATDLLAVPTVDRPLPPEPMSPRLTTGLGLTVLLAGLASFVLWRRRVRA